MKFIAKRSLALLMTLAMCVTLFCAAWTPAQAATVEYVKSGNYIYNWGHRDTVATFLSPMAEEFYADNNTSYEKLVVLSGASNVGSVPSSALYRELQNLMKKNHKKETSYNDTRGLYQYTDCQDSGKTSKKISSFYSGVLIGPNWDGGSTWNREHTWPNSKGLEGNDENDIMMLRPTSVSENSSRGNTAYGESSGYYNPNSLGQKLHGDVARIMLYQYVRWGNTTKMWGSSGVMENVNVLLKWVEEDPVDTWELGRNDSVEAITGTRNVFVDYPELVFVLFGAEIPADYTTPSGKAAEGNHSIVATSNNSSYGSVSVSGRVINAHPATGYEAVGYTIVSGTATVTRSGNAFTVDPTSDVSIRINFAPRTQKTVEFLESDGVAETRTVYSGDMITLPGHKGTLANGLTFMGWVEQSVEESTQLPTYYTAGSLYTVSDSVTLYALYSRFDADSTDENNRFEPYSGALTEGDYLLVSKSVAMIAESTGKNRLNYIEVEETDGAILITNEKAVWTIASAGDYWTIYNAVTKSYGAATGVKSQAGLVTSVTEYAKWDVTYKNTGVYDFINKGNNDSGVNPKLMSNGSVGFACYATNYTSGGPISLYKRMNGAYYYFTASECNHANAYDTEAVEPTCTEGGYTAGVYCPDCEIYVSGHEAVEATGHIFDNAEDTDCNACGYVRDLSAERGDANGDGTTNVMDAAILQRHLNGWDVVVVEANADLNGDGKLNVMDLALLQRLLVGWEV